MHVAARRHAAPGIALAGAAIIAVSPITPVQPDVHLPDVHLPHLSASQVELTALTNPLAQWQQVIAKAIDNIGQLGGLVMGDQTPIIKQVIADQLANAAVLSSAAKNALEAINTSVAALPAALQTASGQLAAGDVEGAVQGIVASLLPLVLNLVDGFNAAYPVVTNTAQNMANLVAVVPNLVLPAVLALSGPLFSTVNAGAATAQDVVDAIRGGDIEGLANAIINAPATMTGAVLNGYGNTPLGLPAAGLLSPIGDLGSLTAGTISGLLSLRDIIASALKPLPAPAVRALKAEQTSGAPVAELPAAQADSVTVSVPAASTVTEAAKPSTEDTGSTAEVSDSTGKTEESTKDADAAKADNTSTGKTDESDAADSTAVKPHMPSRRPRHESEGSTAGEAHTTKPSGPKHGSAASDSASDSAPSSAGSSASSSASGSASKSTSNSDK